MELKVQQFVYEKILKDDVVINIPEEPIFFTENHGRSVFGIFPEKAEWNNNKIWNLKIIFVGIDEIIQTDIRVNEKNLTDAISRFEMKKLSHKDYLVEKVIKYLMDSFNEDRVSEQVFLLVYNGRIEEFNSTINNKV